MSSNQPIILVRPHITEKGTRIQAQQQYVFKVHPDANKKKVKGAVEKAFTVKVIGVNTVNMKGKTRRFGKVIGRRKDWKKAYVTLAEGQVIDLSDKQPKE